ncbi:hypothetical protein ACUV84_026090 [Puccinellia chinampoensis]
MSELGTKLAAIIGGGAAVVGMVACCAYCVCRRRVQRRRKAARRGAASLPRQAGDLELGGVVHAPPQPGVRGRSLRVASPPRRSRSAPPELGRHVNAELAVPPPSPDHVLGAAAPPSPAGSDGRYIDFYFDHEGDDE